MSKKLSLVTLVLVAVAAIVADLPREAVLVGAAGALLAVVSAYGRDFVAWVAAGTHYGA